MHPPRRKRLYESMATYKSDKQAVAASAEQVYTKLSDLENLRNVIANIPEEKIPADKRGMLEQVKITSDSISLPAGPVGDIRLQVSRLDPYSRIELSGIGTPVPLTLGVQIDEAGPDRSEVQVLLDIDIPMMLKPMVGGTLQKMVDQFATVMAAIRF